MDSYSESQRLRVLDEEYAQDLLDDEPREPSSRATFLGQTTVITTYPTTAGVFYGVTPVTVSGNEAEGAAAPISALTGTVLAFNIGNGVPTQGQVVECTFVPYCWIFRYD